MKHACNDIQSRDDLREPVNVLFLSFDLIERDSSLPNCRITNNALMSSGEDECFVFSGALFNARDATYGWITNASPLSRRAAVGSVAACGIGGSARRAVSVVLRTSPSRRMSPRTKRKRRRMMWYWRTLSTSSSPSRFVVVVAVAVAVAVAAAVVAAAAAAAAAAAVAAVVVACWSTPMACPAQARH